MQGSKIASMNPNYMKDFSKISPEEIYAYIKHRLNEGVNFLEDEEFRKASEALRNGRRILDTEKVKEFLNLN